MKPPRIMYRIWDNMANQWWTHSKGKSVWLGVDTAMADWNNDRSPYCADPVFSRQRRYELRAFKLAAVA